MSSKCKECGEQVAKTGNYTFRIVPAKRIPKKAMKLIKSGEIYNEQGSQSGMTKFQQFLLKRSKPANILELTCGKCGGVTRIKMLKNWCGANKLQYEKKVESESNCNAPAANLEKKRKKAKKDKTAGLTLPTSVTVIMEERTTPNNSVQQLPNRGGVAHGKTSTSTKVQRQKELEKLNKILFKSKKAKKSGSTLQDFLSSI